MSYQRLKQNKPWCKQETEHMLLQKSLVIEPKNPFHTSIKFFEQNQVYKHIPGTKIDPFNIIEIPI